jgi:hypothetical protein
MRIGKRAYRPQPAWTEHQISGQKKPGKHYEYRLLIEKRLDYRWHCFLQSGAGRNIVFGSGLGVLRRRQERSARLHNLTFSWACETCVQF